MGGGEPVQRARSKDAGARAPVQRLILGADGQYDTRNPGDNAAITAGLRSLDYASLQAVRGLLDPADVQDRYYVELIDYEIERANALGDIDTLGRAEGGVHTTASVFVDGVRITRTEAQQHPMKGQDWYAKVDTGTKQGDAEQRISSFDSEVGTLEDAYGDLDAYLTDRNTGQPVRVRILVAGTVGPCDGCKRRLEVFFQEVLACLPVGSLLWLESAYLNATTVVRRADNPTRYGFEAEAADRTADRLPYHGVSLPLGYR
jgi:hypothetical protein